MTSAGTTPLESRLDSLEAQLSQVQALLVKLSQQLEHQQLNTTQATEHLQQWVTDYVSLRLQQLVPETCEHAPDPELAHGPHLPGTTVPCTEEVVHRVGRIPIPFVRQMVVQKVAQQARQTGLARVDVVFFEQAATF
jgi:uncharacterized coiled-coil protein SlyX